jgi:hypothetical protein
MDIFNANWELWQDILFIVLVALVTIGVIYIVVLLLLSNSRMEADGRRMAKRMAWYERQIEMRRKTLEVEKAHSKAELDESRKELAEKEAAAAEAETKAAKARAELLEQERKIRILLETAEMSKKELSEYQKREGTNVSEDIAVNALTDKAIAESGLETDSRYTDVKLPLGRTFAFTAQDVAVYISKKPNIAFTEGTGLKPANFKVGDKTLALVYALPGGKVRVTFKCGPAYGAKLSSTLKNVSTAKFPYGLLWFTVSNETAPCSLELIQQVIDISYKIARLGY